MKAIISFLLTLSFGTSAFAYSTLKCVSPKEIEYINDSRVGGVHPYPGMVTHLEELKVAGEVIYRQVNREPCYFDECNIQQPDLVDINPENLKFDFNQDSKKVLSSEGRENSPIHRETYLIQFTKNDEVFWMLCESYKALLP